MAKLRKFSAYHQIKRPYTRRSKYKKKSFVKSNPNSKIVKFDLGNLKAEFPVRVSLIAGTRSNIRHEALESARQTANKFLETKVGKVNYHLKIKTYPHHILREHSLASGAGADRMSSGMAHPFGKPVGLAARVKAGQEIFFIDTTNAFIASAKTALNRAKCKLPISCIIKETTA